MTAIFSSGRHLGNYHSLLTLDRNQYDDDKQIFSDRTWNIHHKSTFITLLNETPIKKWLISIVILIPKNIERPKINRIIIIKTYDSKYNLILKIF